MLTASFFATLCSHKISGRSVLMRVAVLRETLPGEARVALVPESVKKLIAGKNEVSIEAGAGEAAGLNDRDYEAAGAKVTSDRTQLLPVADVLVAVQRP